MRGLVLEGMAFRDWFLVLSGGLAGALFSHFIGWWRRPRLKLSFQSDVAGCAVDTPAYGEDEGGQTIEVDQRYLRLKVENRGRTSARGVNVCVTKIEFYSPAEDTFLFDEEVLDLPVALYGRNVFDLPRRGHRFMDVFAVEANAAGLGWRFGFVAPPLRLYRRAYGPGHYFVTVFASANNARSVVRRFQWYWDGTHRGAMVPP
jgi:hypothetical protein